MQPSTVIALTAYHEDAVCSTEAKIVWEEAQHCVQVIAAMGVQHALRFQPSLMGRSM